MLSEKERAMRRRMEKPRSLKVRRYNDHKIYLSKYLSVFYGSKEGDKICEKELNEILLNCMPNIWIRQTYVQGFDCGTITLKQICKHV